VSALDEVLRPQLGRLSDLISSIEEECDETGTVCHGRDLREDGECALAAELIAIFYVIQGALFAAAEVTPPAEQPEPSEPMDPELCSQSQRVDGKWHSWKFDGDDPYIICHYCDEMRDARTGRVVRPAEQRAEGGA
jgi:nitrite reductase/ring-hydroxylating ferredoxin subunit